VIGFRIKTFKFCIFFIFQIFKDQIINNNCSIFKWWLDIKLVCQIMLNVLKFYKDNTCCRKWIKICWNSEKNQFTNFSYFRHFRKRKLLLCKCVTTFWCIIYYQQLFLRLSPNSCICLILPVLWSALASLFLFKISFKYEMDFSQVIRDYLIQSISEVFMVIFYSPTLCEASCNL
jgi:hypothetical protein